MNIAEAISAELSLARFGSKHVPYVDSFITLSLFSRGEKTQAKRSHATQSIAEDFTMPNEQRIAVHKIYEDRKRLLDLSGDLSNYLMAARNLASLVVRAVDDPRIRETEARRILEWCIAAYSMVINPLSKVRLAVKCFDLGNRNGFCVRAAQPIPANTVINELIGLIPTENLTPHSRLSEISPHPKQYQRCSQPRIFFGPIRYVNHLCKQFNAEYVAEDNTLAFYIMTCKDIQEGEEITADYGPEYFKDLKNGCPCQTCIVEWKGLTRAEKKERINRRRKAGRVKGKR